MGPQHTAAGRRLEHLTRPGTSCGEAVTRPLPCHCSIAVVCTSSRPTWPSPDGRPIPAGSVLSSWPTPLGDFLDSVAPETSTGSGRAGPTYPAPVTVVQRLFSGYPSHAREAACFCSLFSGIHLRTLDWISDPARYNDNSVASSAKSAVLGQTVSFTSTRLRLGQRLHNHCRRLPLIHAAV